MTNNKINQPDDIAFRCTTTRQPARTPLFPYTTLFRSSGIVVNAVDANWNVVSTATTNVTITSSDANATIADDNGATAGNMTLVAGTRALSSFTFKTAGARTVTATDAGGALTSSTSANVAVNAGAVTKLQILLPGEVAAPGTATGKTAATPTAQTAGTAIGNGIRVNAVDANWNVVGSATPDVTISTSDSNAASADDNGAAAGNLTLVAGAGTLSSFTFKTVGTRTVTATDAAAALTASTSANVTVTAGAVTKLQILLPGEVAAPGTATGKTAAAPTAQTAGTAIASGIVVNAVDANWNLVSTATTNVTITSSDANAAIADDNSATAGNMTLVAGAGTLSSFTFKTAGTRTVTATDAAAALTASTSANVTVTAGAVTMLQILLPGEVAAPGTATGKTAAAPTAQTAGTAIASGIVVNAVDANWNVVSTATTNVTITSSDANATIADDNGATAGNMTSVAGTRALSSFTFKSAGARTVTATDAGGALTCSTSANVAVNAGAVTKLQILLPGEVAAPGTATGKTAATPTAQTAGTAIASGIVVNAVDANWNVVSTATTNVTITSSDSNAAIADDNDAQAGNLTLVAGTRALSSFTFKTVGTRTVTATDAGGTLTANTSANVSVTAGAVTKLQILLPGEVSAPRTATGKTPFPYTTLFRSTAIASGIVVNAVDDNWNVVSTATTNVTVTSSDANATIDIGSGAVAGPVTLGARMPSSACLT